MKKVLAAIAIVSLSVATTNAQTLEGTVRDNMIVVNSVGGAVDAAGLDFASAGGHLVPVEGNDASPFQFLLSNTANQVTFGNLGTTVTIDGELATSVGYTGADPSSDLSASWGRGAEPVSFPVNVVPEPASGLMAAFAGLAVLGFRRRR